jgi:hypothetical protein
MRIIGRRTWLVAAAATTVLGIAQAPALGAPNVTTPTISIAAKSGLKPVTGDVFVVFRAAGLSSAQIKGSVTGAASGQVLQLFARQFPFKKPAAALGTPLTLTGASTSYSFKVTPTLATRYRVKLFTDASETTQVATSAVQVVFVVAHGRLGGFRTCNRRGQRPVCHQRLHLTVTVPASTLRTERHKPWHVYFGLNLRRSGVPPAPKRLKLGGGHARVVSVRKLNAQQYAATMTFSFRIGNNGYFFLVNACQKDTEPTDGLNLPGHHSCGQMFISAKIPYLG